MNADISIMNHYFKPLTSVCTKNFPMMIPFTEITSKKVLLKVNLIKIGTLEKTEKNTYTLPLFSLILRAFQESTPVRAIVVDHSLWRIWVWIM